MNEKQPLSLLQSMQALQKNGIPTAPYVFVQTLFELEKNLPAIGFPCVLKAVSPFAIHKTEQKAVRLNISSLLEAKKEFSELQSIPGFEGAILQHQINGTELFIGSKKDIQFGCTLVFGIGGTLVELLKDVSIRIPPIREKDPQQMIAEIQHQKILQGYRGKPKVNEKQLQALLMRASKMIEKLQPEELDINPLMANEKGIFAVDCRIVL